MTVRESCVVKDQDAGWRRYTDHTDSSNSTSWRRLNCGIGSNLVEGRSVSCSSQHHHQFRINVMLIAMQEDVIDKLVVKWVRVLLEGNYSCWRAPDFSRRVCEDMSLSKLLKIKEMVSNIQTFEI